MRNIDNLMLQLPVGWPQKAHNATQVVIGGQRNADELSSVWKELKSELSRLSKKCCWYCESEIVKTDNAVDHFRPKGKVKGLREVAANSNEFENFSIHPVHNGYKWSAFRYENFRYSCDLCNEYRKDLDGTHGGKTSYFPLFDESQRANNLLDEDNEEPLLLDPCNVQDWELLSYDIQGKPFSRFDTGSLDDLKVRFSIYVYHLDYEGINQARVAKWVKLRPLIENTKRSYLRYLRGDQGTKAQFERDLRIIRNQLNPQVNCSYYGFLIYMLKQDTEFQNHPWMGTLIGLVK